MLPTKEELKTDKLILWLDDVNVFRNKHNINICYVFFNVNTFYRKVGKQWYIQYIYLL